jgi:cell division protein FtsL
MKKQTTFVIYLQLVALAMIIALVIAGASLNMDNRKGEKEIERLKGLISNQQEQVDLIDIELDILTVIEVGKSRGLSEEDIKIALQIIQAESGFNCNAIGVNWHESGNFYSLDIGCWQLNSHYQSEVAGKNANRKCLLEIFCSTHLAIDIFEEWGNWTAWVTYNNFIK